MQLMNINQNSSLYNYVSTMRKSCNKFLQKCNFRKQEAIDYGGYWGYWESWYCASALGEMRGVFGIMILQIASSYGLSVENDLASIIPNYEQDLDGEVDE